MSQVPPNHMSCPAITFSCLVFNTLDLEAQVRYFSYIPTTELAGLLNLGTNAETMLLTLEERKTLIATARRAVDSAFITPMAQRHPNIIGIKLTRGSVAKITWLTTAQPRSHFAVFGGQSNFMVGRLASDSSGHIAAFTNVLPKTIARIYALPEGGNDESLALRLKAAFAEQSHQGGNWCYKVCYRYPQCRRCKDHGCGI